MTLPDLAPSSLAQRPPSGAFASHYQGAPCGVHVLDDFGIYSEINDTELAWLGCAPDELIGRLGPQDFMAPGDRQHLVEATARARAHGTRQVAECRLTGRHGVQRDVSITVQWLPGGAGAAAAIRSMVFDVTARKSAEQRLERLNRKQSAMLNTELVGIARMRNRHLVWTNAGMERIYGYTAAEMVGMPARELYPDDASFEALGAAAYPLLNRGGLFRGDVIMVRKDGARIWIEMNGVMVDPVAGEVLWMVIDVTARVDAEQALRDSQALLARTGALAGVGGWQMDLASGRIRLTEESTQILGMPAACLQYGWRDFAGHLAGHRRQLRRAFASALEAGLGFDLEVLWTRTPDRPLWVRLVASLECVNGRPARLVGAAQDVTARVEQMKRVEHLYRLAEQQRTELARFHDAAKAEAEQAGFLISRLSHIEELKQTGVNYFWEPAEVFSGDVIAVARSTTGDVYGLLADATGHGLAAAINLIPLTAAFRAMVAKGFNLLTITEQLNAVVKNYSLADRFVAATLVRFGQRERQIEVVNAGNPSALLVDRDRKVLREFTSGSVPLGILDRQHFKPRVETLELQGEEQLLMFSDGLIEALDAEGRPFGRAGLDRALAQSAADRELIPQIRAELARHAGELARTDDISVLVLSCADLGPVVLPQGPISVPLPADEPGADPVPLQDPWRVSLQLSSRELRRVEGVPMVLDLTRTLGLGVSVEARFFTILSELFQNALEHGLLALDSRIKSEPDGFDRYLDLRAERLAALSGGSIEISLVHWADQPSGGRLQLVVTDTGPGFDHQEHLRRLKAADANPAAPLPSGRGIALLMRLCDRVEFNAEGNQASVSFTYA